MKKIKLPGLILTAIIFMAASLSGGCTFREKADIYAKGFLNCIIQKDYKGAYERTYPYSAQSLKEEEFIKKYTDIFNDLKITSVKVEDGKSEQKDGSATYTYKAKYISEKYGEFNNTFTMLLRPYEDAMRVDWNPSLIFPDMDFGDTIGVSTLKGKRGEILTADSVPLAKNDFAETVFVNLTKSGEFASFGPALCEKLQLKPEDLQKKYDKAVQNKQDILIVNDYPKDHFDEAKIDELKSIPGVDIDTEKYTDLRYYPLKEAAAHIVGYTSVPDVKKAAELKNKGLDPAIPIGAEGLEKVYEDKLRGADGEAVTIKDERGAIKATLYKKEAVNGNDVVTTIDSRLQEKAYTQLALKLVPGQSGVAIVMNPETGEIQAAATYPSYNSNIFSFPIDNALWDEIKKYQSLYPLVTQGRYPPGSAIKPFTAAAALEEGKVTQDTAFPYPNEISNNVWRPSLENWDSDRGIKRFDDKAGSPLKLDNSLIHSDNIYFAWAALQLGKDKLVEYLKKYTLEQEIPFDLPLAVSNIFNKDSTIGTMKLAEMGYGQGQILVTPLQLAAMYTAFCDNGDMMKPMLVKKLMKENGLKYEAVEENQPSVMAEGVIQPGTIQTLLPLMERVVNEGTATGVKIPDVRIAGKTGTAQKGEDKSKEISWFAGFWVEQKEKRLVLVMVDVKEGEGSNLKQPIAKVLLTPDLDDANTNTTPSNTPKSN